jgi:hypothetical protein
MKANPPAINPLIEKIRLLPKGLGWVEPVVSPVFDAGRFVLIGLGNVIGYLYLSRVPALGLLMLWALPILAVTALRTLVIGAYDLEEFLKPLWVGLALCAVAGSIFISARTVWEAGAARFGTVWESYEPALKKLWMTMLALAVITNVVVALCVSDPEHFWRVFGGLLTAFLLALLFHPMIVKIRKRLTNGRFGREFLKVMIVLGTADQPGYLYRGERVERTHTSAMAFGIILGGLYTLFAFFNVPIPALVAVMMVIAIGVLVLAAAAFFLDRYRIPLLLVVFAYCSIMSLWWQNDHYYRVWPRAQYAPAPPTPRDVLVESVCQDRPIVVVAAAGGGIQSAAWTTAVLRHIDEALKKDAAYKDVDFAGSVRLISGVSGGSVGGMFFALMAGRTEPDRLQKAEKAAARSGLAAAMRGLLRADVIRALAPFLVKNGGDFPISIYSDRGQELEMAWVRNADVQFPKGSGSGLGKATLSNWSEDARTLRRPALIFNSTSVETGERLALSTAPTTRMNVGSCEFSTRFNADLAMTTAARLSATFPGVSPTARPGPSRNATAPGYSLPGVEFRDLFPRGGNYLHQVDGGFYENSGIVAAVEWIDEALSEMVKNHDPLPKKILFLELNAFPLEHRPDESDPPKSTDPAIDAGQSSRGTIYDLTSSLSAIIHVRNNAQKAFAARVLELCRARWVRESGHPVEIMSVSFYYNFEQQLASTAEGAVGPAEEVKTKGWFVDVDPDRQPLSWHLRPAEQKDLQRHLEKLEASTQVEQIKEFFKP